VLLREAVSLALARERVEEHRPLHFLQLLQHLEQGPEIVPVDGPVVLEAELLEEDVRYDEVLQALLDAPRQGARLAARGHLAEELPDVDLEAPVDGRGG